MERIRRRRSARWHSSVPEVTSTYRTQPRYNDIMGRDLAMLRQMEKDI